jgi:hypothetical protein
MHDFGLKVSFIITSSTNANVRACLRISCAPVKDWSFYIRVLLSNLFLKNTRTFSMETRDWIAMETKVSFAGFQKFLVMKLTLTVET